MAPKPLIAATAILAGLLTLAGCASAPEVPPASPSVIANPGQPAPTNARLFVDCIAQAITDGRYDRDSDPDTELLRFACSGPPARAFYDSLAARSLAKDSEIVADGRTWRFTEKLIRDAFGADGCSTDVEATIAA